MIPIPVIPYTYATVSLHMVKRQENEINILCKDDILYLGRPIIYLLWRRKKNEIWIHIEQKIGMSFPDFFKKNFALKII